MHEPYRVLWQALWELTRAPQARVKNDKCELSLSPDTALASTAKNASPLSRVLFKCGHKHDMYTYTAKSAQSLYSVLYFFHRLVA
jgi:hypothetical protein